MSRYKCSIMEGERLPRNVTAPNSRLAAERYISDLYHGGEVHDDVYNVRVKTHTKKNFHYQVIVDDNPVIQASRLSRDEVEAIEL